MEHNEEFEGLSEPLINQREIGNRIRDLRKKHGLSQDQVAEYMDISVSFCGLAERGDRMMALPKLVKLCDYYSVSLDYLILGKEDSDSKPENEFIDILTLYTNRFTPQERRFLLSLIQNIMKLRK